MFVDPCDIPALFDSSVLRGEDIGRLCELTEFFLLYDLAVIAEELTVLFIADILPDVVQSICELVVIGFYVLGDIVMVIVK